jgi:hypothetical protein
MTDLFDTRQIPDDHEYWDSLAARVARGSQQGGFIRFAATPLAWAAALLLVAGAGLLVLAASRDTPPDLGREIAQALAPADFPGGSLVEQPRVDVLLFEAAARPAMKRNWLAASSCSWSPWAPGSASASSTRSATQWSACSRPSTSGTSCTAWSTS